MPVRVLALFDTRYQSLPGSPDPWARLRAARPQSRRYPALNWPATLGAYDLAKPDQAAAIVGLAANAGIDGFVVEIRPEGGAYVTGAGPIAALCRAGRLGLAYRWNNAADSDWNPARAGALVAALTAHREAHLDGRPILFVEAPTRLADASAALAGIRGAASAAGLAAPLLIASRAESPAMLDLGFDLAVDPDPADWASCPPKNRPSGLDILEIQAGLRDSVELTDKFLDYQLFAVSRMINREKRGKVLPRVLPSFSDWESHPEGGATILVNNSASSGVDTYVFGLFLENAIAYAHANFAPGEQIVLLDSWNHWLNGSQVEPSVLDGDMIYNTVRTAIDKARYFLRSRSEEVAYTLDPAIHQRIAQICDAAASVKRPQNS